MERIDIRLTEEEKIFLKNIAQLEGASMKEVIMNAVKKQYENEYSLYPEFIDLLKRISQMQQAFDYYSSQNEDIHSNEFQMSEILNQVEQVMIRAKSITEDQNNQVFIDDPLMLEEDEKPYWRSKFDYTKIDIEFFKGMKQ